MSGIWEFPWAKLGVCIYCMRAAFQSAAFAWIALVPLSTLMHSIYLSLLATVCALGLTLLWVIAHPGSRRGCRVGWVA